LTTERNFSVFLLILVESGVEMFVLKYCLILSKFWYLLVLKFETDRDRQRQTETDRKYILKTFRESKGFDEYPSSID
jgi:hypothetical protein